MIPVRIVMRPMQQAAAIVPFVLTADSHRVPDFDLDSFREIDIMRDEESLTVVEFDQETLMT